VILATQADVVARLGRALTADELARLPGLLQEASLLVEGYLGVVYQDPADSGVPIPPAVVVVVSRIVARTFAAPSPQLLPEGARSAGSGPYSISFGDARTNLWLSKADKTTLRNLGGGFTSVALKSERC
jgi:hypothetical protein